MDAKQTETKTSNEAANQSPGKTSYKKMTLADTFRHGAACVDLAKRHHAALARCGWTPQHTEQLERDLLALQSFLGKQTAAQRTAVHATKEQRDAVQAVRDFRRRFVAGLYLIQSRTRAGIDVAQLTYAALGETPGSMLAWTLRVQTLVGELDHALPEGAVAALEVVRVQLSGCVSQQEAAQRQAKLATQEVVACRGAITAMIGEIQHAALIAFFGDAAVLGEFRLREVRKAKAAEGTEDGKDTQAA